MGELTLRIRYLYTFRHSYVSITAIPERRRGTIRIALSYLKRSSNFTSTTPRLERTHFTKMAATGSTIDWSALFPVDLVFVKVFTSFHPCETYYIFIRGEKLACAHFSTSIDEWGAWELSIADVAALGLQNHHLASSAQADRAFLDVETRFAKNRSGLLSFLWQEVSMLPEVEREKKVFLSDSCLISRLACILVKKGIAVEDDVAEALILRGEGVVRDSGSYSGAFSALANPSKPSESDPDLLLFDGPSASVQVGGGGGLGLGGAASSA